MRPTQEDKAYSTSNATLRIKHLTLHPCRRPTRWLKGLDGKEDFKYGVYMHEAAAAEVLGPKWGGRSAAEVGAGFSSQGAWLLRCWQQGV